MAYQPVTATALVELIWECDAQRVENTLYVSHDESAWTLGDLNGLAAIMTAWATTWLCALASEQVSLVQVDCTDLSEQFGAKYELPTLPAQPGTQASPVAANNVTFTTTFATGHRGRSFRGRNYFIGMPESKITKSTVDSTWAGQLLGAYQALLAGGDYLTGDLRWVHVSRVVNGVVQEPTALRNPVTSVYHADLYSDSQRRRLPGRGT